MNVFSRRFSRSQNKFTILLHRSDLDSTAIPGFRRGWARCFWYFHALQWKECHVLPERKMRLVTLSSHPCKNVSSWTLSSRPCKNVSSWTLSYRPCKNVSSWTLSSCPCKNVSSWTLSSCPYKNVSSWGLYGHLGRRILSPEGCHIIAGHIVASLAPPKAGKDIKHQLLRRPKSPLGVFKCSLMSGTTPSLHQGF